ncbi:MAG: hypothetical protein IPJ06_20950 [Saprospiraceae bacterium]|nr:hypothetical protein [Saprospiraceae bacterium]
MKNTPAMSFIRRTYPLLLILIASGIVACGQTESSTDPVSTEEKTASPALDFPPATRDSLDRTGWVVKEFGVKPITLAIPKPLVSMGNQVPESAKKYIVGNETFSGIHGDDFQMIVNIIEYVPTVSVDLKSVAGKAAEQMRSDVAVSHFELKETPITVSGSQGIRQDAKMFRDGLIHYWCNTLVQKGQEVFQVTVIYPETYREGPGDAEAMMASIQISQ